MNSSIVMRIRPAFEVDLPALARLHGASFSQVWDSAALAGLLAHGSKTLLAEQDGAILGFVLYRLAADEAEILTLVCAAEARRRGIARHLVQAAATDAADSGAAHLFLEVGTDNEPARGLYAALGFKQIGQRKEYYPSTSGKSEDALLLSCSLPLSGLGKPARLD